MKRRWNILTTRFLLVTYWKNSTLRERQTKSEILCIMFSINIRKGNNQCVDVGGADASSSENNNWRRWPQQLTTLSRTQPCFGHYHNLRLCKSNTNTEFHRKTTNFIKDTALFSRIGFFLVDLHDTGKIAFDFFGLHLKWMICAAIALWWVGPVCADNPSLVFDNYGDESWNQNDSEFHLKMQQSHCHWASLCR